MHDKFLKLLAVLWLLPLCLAAFFGMSVVTCRIAEGASPATLQGEESSLMLNLPFEFTAARQEVQQQGQNAQYLREWNWSHNAGTMIISVDLVDMEDGAFRGKLAQAGSEEAVLNDLQAGTLEGIKGRLSQQGIQLGQLQKRSYKIGSSPATYLWGNYQTQGKTQRADILFVLHGTNFWSIIFDSQQGNAAVEEAIGQAVASVSLTGTGFAGGGDALGRKDTSGTGEPPVAGGSGTAAREDPERMKIGGGIVLLGLAVAAYGFFKKN